MARGMVVGEPIVSQAQTREFDEGYERAFGKDRKPQRGRWVWDAAQGRLVPASEYRAPPPEAKDAALLVGRFYEGVPLPDGTVVQSRKQYNDHLRAKGLTNASDFSPGYFDGVKKEQAREMERSAVDAVREQFDRVSHMDQRRYDREAAERMRRRARGE